MGTAASTLAAAAGGTTAQPTWAQKLINGITIPYIGLVILTLLPPTGMIGLNHSVLNNQALAFMKAGSTAACLVVINFLLPYYPSYLRESMLWLSYFGPWYIFDIIQVINSVQFKKFGFKLPLNIEMKELFTPHTGEYGEWTLNTTTFSVILTACSSYLFLLNKLLPPGIIPSDIQANINVGTGGAAVGFTAVAIIAMLFSKPPVTSEAPQTGGGSLPPLSEFADKLLKSKSPDESYAFFSVIALIVFGGLATAWSKYPST
jgi:hypothetical protein